MEVTKWEYCSDSGMELNELGKVGWEAYAAQPNGMILLKRPAGKIYVREMINGVEINQDKKLNARENDSELSY